MVWHLGRTQLRHTFRASFMPMAMYRVDQDAYRLWRGKLRNSMTEVEYVTDAAGWSEPRPAIALDDRCYFAANLILAREQYARIEVAL